MPTKSQVSILAEEVEKVKVRLGIIEAEFALMKERARDEENQVQVIGNVENRVHDLEEQVTELSLLQRSTPRIWDI